MIERENDLLDSGAKYWPAFDYLRIVLVLIVALGHSGVSMWSPAGNFAVQVFFALSGWLIAGILLRLDRDDLPKFYFNRAARIWIPYFIAIGLLVTESLLNENVTRKWFEFIFYDLTFVYNFYGAPLFAASQNAMPLRGTGNHFWSICAEEQFYLVAPLLITILRQKSIWFWCAVFGLALISPYWGYFASISLGVLACVVRTKLGDWQVKQRARASLLIAFIVIFAAMYFELVPYWLGAPFSAVTVVLLLAVPGAPSDVATFLGGISYPMYLNHWMGIFLANDFFGKRAMNDTFIAHTTAVILSLIIAAALYMIVDLNIRRYRDAAFSDSKGRAIAICGFALVAMGLVGGFVQS